MKTDAYAAHIPLESLRKRLELLVHPGTIAWDLRVSRARAALDWKAMIAGCVDPQRAEMVFSTGRSRTEGACTMCGEFCAIRRMAPSDRSSKDSKPVKQRGKGK